MTVTSADAESPPLADRAARGAERIIRVLGDGRTGVTLLAVAGLANLVAALVPGGAELLAGPWRDGLQHCPREQTGDQQHHARERGHGAKEGL